MRATTNDKSNWIQMENTRRQILFTDMLFVNLFSSLIMEFSEIEVKIATTLYTWYPKLMQTNRDKLNQDAIDIY